MRKPPSIDEFARLMPVDCTGLNIRRNPLNGFIVIELDYVADPKKRNPIWIDEERRGMPVKQWAVEMERRWEVYAGRPVYEGAFAKHLHVLPNPLPPNPNFPIFRGWDFGGNQSTAITQVIGRRLIVLDEIPNGGTNTRKFAPEVIAYCNMRFGTDYHYIDVVDPSAMWEGKTAEGKACTDVMREEGLYPVASPTNDPQKRTDAVTKLLMATDNGQACLVLNPHCTMLIEGFSGGYHFPDKPTQAKRMDRPVKNLYSHIHDALQYVACRMQLHAKRNQDEEIAYETSLTRPRYSFCGKDQDE